MMHFGYIALACSLPVLSFMLFTPKNLYTYISSLSTHLSANELAPLLRFCEACGISDDQPSFWVLSKGLTGIVERLIYSIFFLLIAHALWRKGLVNTRDIAYLVLRMVLQIWYSIKSLPEIIYCRAMPHRPHFAANMALICHSQLAIRTCTLTSSAGDDLSMFRLDDLL